jgi:hypothetical protein
VCGFGQFMCDERQSLCLWVCTEEQGIKKIECGFILKE